MNKREFIGELRSRLKRLPPDEIEYAVNYYEEYFNDAGVENEAQTIAALGSPAAVASKIIGEYAVNDAKKERKGKSNPLLITILAVCASPIALPIGISIIAIAISLVAVFFSLWISGVALAIVGFASILAGIWAFSYGFGTGLLYLGAGLFTLALGIAATISISKLGRKVFRRLQKWMGRLLIRRATK